MGMKVIPAMQIALLALKNNPFALLASILTDVLSLMFFGYLSAPVYAKLTEHVIIIGTLVSKQIQPERGQSIVTALYSADISGFVKQLVMLLGLLLLIAYVIFVLSQGINFSIAKFMSGRKTRIFDEMLTTARIAVFWSVVLAIFYVLNMLMGVRQVIINKSMTGVGLIDALNAIEVLLAITALATFAAGGVGKGLGWIVRQKAEFVFASAVMLLLFGAISFILRLLSFNPQLVLLAGLLTFFPAVALSRIFFIQLSSSGEKK